MGPLVTQVKASYLQDEGYISNCKVIQFHMNYATDAQKESFAYLSKRPQDCKNLFPLEQNFINENENRLDFVTKVVDKCQNNSLVLFHKIAYGEKLYNKLCKINNKKVYYVDGTVETSLREDFKSRMEKGDDVIIVASYGTFSTGISIKNIHNVHFTESFKSEVIIRQSIGRGLRKHHNKDVVKIYDYVDDLKWGTGSDEWLNYVYRHGITRRKIYKEEKFPFEIQSINF